ncbi:MAG: acyl-CoA thioesterase, partial [Actinomycetota bacterium]|nr:acyl-CoA thioesterase [Actinomycetota bacterium]
RDLDGLGHVNNAVYLTYVESARVEFLRHLGLVDTLESVRMIVARVEVDFRAPVRFGEVVDVGCRVSRFGRKSFDLDHALYVGDRHVADVKSVLVAYDYERRASMELPPEWRRSLAA